MGQAQAEKSVPFVDFGGRESLTVLMLRWDSTEADVASAQRL